MSLLSNLRDPRGPGGARLVLALGAVTIWLALAAIVGAITLGGDDGEDELLAGGGTTPADPESGSAGTQPGQQTTADDGSASTTDPARAATSDPADGGEAVPTGADTGTEDTGTATTAPAETPDAGGGEDAPSGDTTGVTDSEVKIGVHAPMTISGAPLNLAEDPIKGLETYVEHVNQNGGVNGRKIRLQIEDDRYEVSGAQQAANALINDGQNFMVSGTLGIDQVAVVAAEAQRRGVPYTAAGGSEEAPIPWMIQLSASYTTHAIKLAEFIASDPDLSGKRIGILVSDSQYIEPVAATFEAELERRGETVSTTVVNQKPQQNPNYSGYVLQFRQADTEVVVPLTDPLTTAQIVQQCAAGAACGWTYTFSNFAHDSDTALELFAPTWSQQGVRGLSNICYYLAPEVDGENCGAMATARDQYIALNGQEAWEDEGSGASAGYQIVGFIRGGLQSAGTDLTRERFRSALLSYNGYSDLVSGPITTQGSQNLMHGAEKMAVYEAQSDNRYQMISPGLVDGF